jgi:hypothetical protein
MIRTIRGTYLALMNMINRFCQSCGLGISRVGRWYYGSEGVQSYIDVCSKFEFVVARESQQPTCAPLLLPIGQVSKRQVSLHNERTI